MDLFLYERVDSVYRVTEKDVSAIRDALVRSRTNGGYPYILAVDDDFGGRGELLLLHRYEGLELDPKYVNRTLPLVYRLWGKPVHLQTRTKLRGEFRYCYNGNEVLMI